MAGGRRQATDDKEHGSMLISGKGSYHVESSELVLRTATARKPNSQKIGGKSSAAVRGTRIVADSGVQCLCAFPEGLEREAFHSAGP